ncbi:MAG: ABC transporter permease [Coriobacteriia bacterium]|nr:ABC transporter permease [Coriobacteriia bacterium]
MAALEPHARRRSVLLAFTWRSLAKNRVRTVVTIVGIALACALFLAVGVSAQSVYLYVGDVARATSGAYNAAASGVSRDAVARAAQTPGVTRVAWLSDEGYARIDTSTTLTPYLHVSGMSPDVGDVSALEYLTALHLTSGRMPQDVGEIVLPQALVDSGVIEARLGDELTLQVGVRRASDGALLGWADQARQADRGASLDETLVDTVDRTFTVVGFYADNAALTYAAGIPGSFEAGYPALTVASDPLLQDAGDAPSAYQLWVGVTDPTASVAVLAQIVHAGEKGAPSGSHALLYENHNVNSVTSFSLDRGIYLTMLGFAIVVCAVVVVASTLLIRNAFAVSVTQRTRQFGLLSSVGATPRQLRGLVLREALVIDLIAAPFGIVVGYAGAAAVLTAARGTIVGALSDGAESVAFHVALSPVMAIIALVLALVTTLLSAWGPARRASRMTAVDAIRSASDVRVPARVQGSGRVMGRLFGVSGLLAARSFRRDARPRRAVTVSLVTGVTLVVTALLVGAYSGSFLGAVTPSASDEFGDGYDLRYSFSESNIDSDDADLTPQVIARRLGRAAGVDDSTYALSLTGMPVRVSDGATPADAFNSDYLAAMPEGRASSTVQFVDDNAYRAWLEERGLSANELMDAEHPRAVAVNRMRLNDGTHYSTVAPFARAAFAVAAYVGVNEEVLASASSGVLPPDLSDEAQRLSDMPVDGLVVPIGFEVGALCEDVPWWVGVPEEPTFLLPLSAAQTVAPHVADAANAPLFPARSWSVWFRAADDAQAQASLTGVLQDVGLSPVRLYNRAAAEAMSTANNLMAQVFLWSFAAIVTLIALTGTFNAMYTSVVLRQRELAMLRSCGLTRRGMRGELVCECLLHTGRVALWAVPIAMVVSLLFWVSLSRTVAGAQFVLPWGVLPALAVVLLVTLAAGALAQRRVREADLVSILRTEAV